MRTNRARGHIPACASARTESKSRHQFAMQRPPNSSTTLALTALIMAAGTTAHAQFQFLMDQPLNPSETGRRGARSEEGYYVAQRPAQRTYATPAPERKGFFGRLFSREEAPPRYPAQSGNYAQPGATYSRDGVRYSDPTVYYPSPAAATPAQWPQAQPVAPQYQPQSFASPSGPSQPGNRNPQPLTRIRSVPTPHPPSPPCFPAGRRAVTFLRPARVERGCVRRPTTGAQQLRRPAGHHRRTSDCPNPVAHANSTAAVAAGSIRLASSAGHRPAIHSARLCQSGLASSSDRAAGHRLPCRCAQCDRGGAANRQPSPARDPRSKRGGAIFARCRAVRLRCAGGLPSSRDAGPLAGSTWVFQPSLWPKPRGGSRAKAVPRDPNLPAAKRTADNPSAAVGLQLSAT